MQGAGPRQLALLVGTGLVALAGAIAVVSRSPPSPQQRTQDPGVSPGVPILEGPKGTHAQSAGESRSDADGRANKTDQEAWLLRGFLERGDLTGLKHALASGSDPNAGSVAKGGSGLTPLVIGLHQAEFGAGSGLGAVVLLLGAGADPRQSVPSLFQDQPAASGLEDIRWYIKREVIPTVVDVASGIAWRGYEESIRLHAGALRAIAEENLEQDDPALAFSLAVLADDLGTIERLLVAGFGTDKVDSFYGERTLIVEAQHAYHLRRFIILERILRVMERSRIPLDDDTGRFTPLALAAARGDTVALRELLDKGELVDGSRSSGQIPVDGRREEQTPLWHAARAGQGPSVVLLLEAGADPQLGASSLAFADILLAATTGGSPEVIEALRGRGVPFGGEDLQRAIVHADPTDLPRLLELSAEPSIAPALAWWPWLDATTKLMGGRAGVNGNGGVRVRIDALGALVRAGQLDKVKEALRLGTSPNGQWPDLQVTPVEWAAAIPQRGILQVLLDAGADHSALLRVGPDGVLPLVRAEQLRWNDIASTIRVIQRSQRAADQTQERR